MNEVENDGYGSTSALADLVGRLNAETAEDAWAYIDADTGTGQVNALGTDAIKVGMIYQRDAVTPVGMTAALNTQRFVNGGDNAPRDPTRAGPSLPGQLDRWSLHRDPRTTSRAREAPARSRTRTTGRGTATPFAPWLRRPRGLARHGSNRNG